MTNGEYVSSFVFVIIIYNAVFILKDPVAMRILMNCFFPHCPYIFGLNYLFGQRIAQFKKTQNAL